jgi:23S rRNA pseudouridine1911/1915/1917 synthase
MAPKQGLRIDHWVKEAFPMLNNRQVNESIETQLVTDLLGKRVTKGDRLEDPKNGLDTSRLEDHIQTIKKGNPNLNIPIVYEEADFWIVDKPSGIASHPISLFDFETVTHWAFARLLDLQNEFEEFQPTITPHRLDTGTSGLLIVSKTKAAYQLWRERFIRRQVSKKYLAWAWGTPDRSYYLNQNPIAHHPNSKNRMVTIRQRYIPPVLEARSEILVVEVLQNPNRFRCEIKCETGVMHQVRVHLSDLGFPLVGDVIYDSDFESRELKPLYHELRASEIGWEDKIVVAPT